MVYDVVAIPVGQGRFSYHVIGTDVRGISTAPLLDACRQLKRMGAETGARVVLFHGDRLDQWTLRTTVGKGAELTVKEPPTSGPKFVKFRSMPVQ